MRECYLMITSRSEYKKYLRADMNALSIKGNILFNWLTDPIFRYERALKKHEYYHNCFKSFLLRLLW